jgi:hypothetical protein
VANFRFSRAIQFGFVALIAVVFFFVGYSARTVRTASAQAPHPTPSFVSDGDPSGHYLVPQGARAKLSAATSVDLAAALKVFSDPNIRLAIRYVATRPPKDAFAPFAAPRCTNQPQPCVDFTWKNMKLTNKYADGETHDRTVDIYGTISLK